MTIALLAAIARNRTIGKNNALPWRLPDDLRHFRTLTLGKSVIMGRKTFESLPAPLVGRHSIVVSRDTHYRTHGAQCETAYSLEEALKRGQSAEIFIIGGASLYAQTLPLADRLYITAIDNDVEGDTFFPLYEQQAWRTVAEEPHAADARHAYPFRFLVLERAV